MLIVVGAFVALVIFTLELHAQRGAHEWRVRVLAWGVIAASILVVAAAAQRVLFYEAAYGYTQERLYVQVCCVAIALAMAVLAFEGRQTLNAARLTRRIAVVAILCAGGFTWWNSDAWIVAANVARYRQTNRIDAGYLAQLVQVSPDAVPELITRLPQLPAAAADQLRDDLLRLSISEGAWYEWNLRRSAAITALCSTALAGAATRCPRIQEEVAVTDTRAHGRR
jgi:hypothetical protein